MLAHELGRLVLHSTCIGTDVEDHANAFAADAGEVVRGAWPSCGHPALMRTRVRGATGVIAMKTVAHIAVRLSASCMNHRTGAKTTTIRKAAGPAVYARPRAGVNQTAIRARVVRTIT